MKASTLALIPLLFLISLSAFATDFGSIRGIVHDPQHRPVQNAMVMLKAKASDWSRSAVTDSNGEFQLDRKSVV